MSIKILPVILLSLILLTGATECEDYVKTLISDIEAGHFAKIPLPAILYSGLAPNCPGQFLECKKSLGFSYYLVYFPAGSNVQTLMINKNLLGFFTGLCVPSFCTLEDVQKIQSFSRATIYSYDDDRMTVFGWIGLVSLLTYIVVILVATVLRSLKDHKVLKQAKGRLSDQQSQNQINHSLRNESTVEPISTSSVQHQSNSILDSFNGYQNYTKIFQINPKRNILFGPKCIAILMIVVAFEYSFRQTVAMNNITAQTLLNKSMGYVITNVELAFATLFWIFGINAAYSLFKIETFTDIFRSILNKLVRTWPVLVLYTLFAYGITNASMDQPLNALWNMLYTRSCPSIFWRKWMLVNTMIPDNTTCLPWTWVFEVELFLYIISPMFVIINKTKKTLGYSLLALCIVVSLGFSFMILELKQTSFYPSLIFNNEHEYVYHFQMHPLTRTSHFFFGLLLGIFINHGLDESNAKPVEHIIYKRLKTSRVHQWLLQIMGLAFICTAFFMIITIEDTHSKSTFVRVFVVLIPVVMLLGLSLLVLPSFFHGKAHLTNALNYLLGQNFWSPLYKLSNSIYLAAPIVIGITTYSLQTGIYFSYEEVTLLFLGDLALTLFLSLIICSCLEMPFGEVQRRMETFIFGSRLSESVAFIDN